MIIWCIRAVICCICCWFAVVDHYCHKVVNVGLSCKVVRCRPNYWGHIRCSWCLRCKMLSPCILIQSWGLDALEPLLNHVGGLMPWSLFTLNYVEGLMPWSHCSTTLRAWCPGAFLCSNMLGAWCPGAFLRSIMLRAWCPGLVPHAFAYQDDLRWF
jgi:hypothetical protein